MKPKKKYKILRYFSIFFIISIILVFFAFPISALDIGGGATLTGIKSQTSIGDEFGSGKIYDYDSVDEVSDSIKFYFNLSQMVIDGYDGDILICNRSYYTFNCSNNYGTLNFSIKGLFLDNTNPAISAYLYDSNSNKYVITLNKKSGVDSDSYYFSYTGYIPTNFYVESSWFFNPVNYPYENIIAYNLSFSPRDPVADKLNEKAYPSFGDSQGAIDDSNVLEDNTLGNANDFIDNTVDFVFDRSLFTEGNFINGLRVASTTFENFASIPFIGTILKYAVIFGLIGFVLGLATFFIRRRN